jgi:four helix bundle protein
VQDFRRLAVWRRAHGLTLAVYRVTAAFPREERFGIASQLRRATTSDADFRRCLQIALGSASEAEYQLLLASDLDLLPPQTYQALTHDCIEVNPPPAPRASQSRQLTADSHPRQAR